MLKIDMANLRLVILEHGYSLLAPDLDARNLISKASASHISLPMELRRPKLKIDGVLVVLYIPATFGFGV